MARIRVLVLIAKLFSISSSVVSAIYHSNLLGLLEAEVNDKNDMLMTLSALELLYEDGHLRVFKWSSMEVLLNQPDAHASVRDLDFSSDGRFLASLGSSGPCRV